MVLCLVFAHGLMKLFFGSITEEVMKAGLLYFRITAEADRLALRVKAAFAERGIPFHVDSPTNQQFVCLTDAQAEALGREFTFEEEGRTADGLRIARFCTSWATTEEEVDTLIAAIRAL